MNRRTIFCTQQPQIPHTGTVRRHAYRISIGFTASLLLASPLVAGAQYTGPSNQSIYTSIADVLADPVDDRAVELEGHILRRIDEETYQFSDGDAEVRIELEREDLPPTKIDDKTRVRLVGEVDASLTGDPEIEVDRVTVIEGP